MGLASLALLFPLCPWAAMHASQEGLNRALIQERGIPLQPGHWHGFGAVPLERAEAGDTPILTFQSERGPVRLLLDTGAATAMVTPALVHQLGLSSVLLSPAEFSLAGGGKDCDQLQLSKTQLPELQLSLGTPHANPVRLVGLEAVVLPVVALPKGVDGVLGASSLKQIPFVIDPRTERMVFGSEALGWRKGVPPPQEVLALVWRRGVPVGGIVVQPVSASPVRHFSALMDTGAEGLFLTPRLGALLRPLARADKASLVGVCGRQDVWRQRLMGMGLGPHASPNQTVEAILTTNPVFALLGVEAIVGQEFFRSRAQLWRLDLDQTRLELW